MQISRELEARGRARRRRRATERGAGRFARDRGIRRNLWRNWGHLRVRDSRRILDMKLLVLGGTGLVGARVLQRALADAGVVRVIAPARVELPLNGKLVNPVGGRLEELVPAAFAEGPDAVSARWGLRLLRRDRRKRFVTLIMSCR